MSGLTNPLTAGLIIAVCVWGVVGLPQPRARGGTHPSTPPRSRSPIALWGAAIVPPAVGILINAAHGGTSPLEAHLTYLAIAAALVLPLALFAATVIHKRHLTIRHPVLVGALLAYWMAGVGSNLFNGLPFGRTSVFAVPLLILAAAFFSPDALAVRKILLWSSLAVCYASLGNGRAPAEYRVLPQLATLARVGRLIVLPGSLHTRTFWLFSRPWRSCLSSPPRVRYRVLNAIAALVTLIGTDSRGAWLATILGFFESAERAREERHVRGATARPRTARVAFAMISGFIGAQVLLYVRRLSTKDTQTLSECPWSKVVLRREGPAHR